MRLRIATWLALVGLLLLAGCASAANSSDNDRNNGFYSGVTGGWSHP